MTKLRTMRELKRLSQKDLATRLGVKQSAVCNAEQKGLFDTRTAKKYAKALECSSFFLLEELSN